jgi:outer membrane protein OmpA-like peptidoglycan-associated protein
MHGRAVRTTTSIAIADKIHFETDKAEILPDSFGTLDAVAATMQGNPDITLLEVQGHADERGGHQHNMRLTEARAQAVMAYLMRKGVAGSRLTSHGYGETKPLELGHNEAAWATNRRVEFVIVRKQ